MKLSQLFKTMREELHVVGSFRLPTTADEKELYGEEHKYCFVGLIQCKAGYYEAPRTDGDGNILRDAMSEVNAFEKFETSAEMYERKYNCPEEGCEYHPLSNNDGKNGMKLRHILVHMNDDHRYTFEQGAKWLESVGL